ncbi:membrane protein [Kaistia sp. 32K]|nr:membrane protein [Kaistia sp. 32K]
MTSAVGGAHAQPTLSPDETYALARDAYLYAYPIVSMDVTMRQATNVPDAQTINLRAPVNRFAHARAYPEAGEKDVVRFNFDTLYSFAWLDLAPEPIIVSVPDTQGRYYLLPMLDMWTDVFAVIGSRTTGTQAGDYAIVAPGWTGSLPDGMARIVAPTSAVWIIGRTKTDGPADYGNVHKVQDGYRLTPLSQWGKDPTAPAQASTDPTIDDKTPPVVQVDNLDGVAMLTRLADLLAKYPPHANDHPILLRLRALGIEPGKPFDPSKLDEQAISIINKAASETLQGLQAAWERSGKVVNGWTIQNDNIGTYGTSYLKRTLVAKGGLGANLPEDAVYPTAAFDGAGEPLTGENRYVLHFEKGKLPPADAFWSITMYDMDGFQVPNPVNRFAIGSYDELAFNDDGSLDIVVQADSPGKDKEANWLPAAKGRFQPSMRIYSPRAEVLDSSWSPPPFTRLN